jgi:hypothetical protein
VRAAFVGHPATQDLVTTAFASEEIVMRKLFVVTSALLVADVVFQLYLAGLGHFSIPADDLFNIHGTNGRIVLPILAILNIAGAAAARAGARTIWLSVLPLVLALFQTVLFILTGAIFHVDKESTAIPIGASILLGFHALNGLAIIAVSGILLGRAIRLARAGTPAAQEAARTPVDAAR